MFDPNISAKRTAFDVPLKAAEYPRLAPLLVIKNEYE
jgi:hypothetical protein